MTGWVAVAVGYAVCVLVWAGYLLWVKLPWRRPR